LTTARYARRLLPALATGALLLLAGCGGGDKVATTSAAKRPSSDLRPIKAYLLQHTARLKADVATLRTGAESYYALAREANFDYAKLLETRRADVRRLVERAQAGFAAANPAYEQMEGVVAGVPSLADYDVIIDAGGDASDPGNAVPFSIRTPDGRTFKQPGNFNYLVETAVFGRSRSSPPRASGPTSTATARSSSARRCPTRTSSSPRCASSSAPQTSSTPRPAAGSRRRRTHSRRWS
jgi:hypothetical protein